MTTEDLELLAAAVDGELTPDQESKFRLLVAESAEATVVYQQLSRDRDRLRALPRKAAPPTVLSRTMARVKPITPRQPIRTRSPWVPVAVAAAVLLAVTVGSFTFFQPQAERIRQEQLAALPVAPLTPVDPPSAPTNTAVAIPPAPKTNSDSVVVRDTLPAPRPVVERPTFLTSPVEPDPRPFETVELRLPLLVPGAELNQDDTRSRIVQELTRDGITRIDLFAADINKAADALATAGKAVALTMSVDAVTADRRRKSIPTALAVVVDSLTPAEVAKWLSGTGDTVQSAHVLAGGAAEAKDWRELTGVDPAAKKPKAGEPASAPRSVSSGTAEQVTGSLARGVEKHALMLTYLPPTVRVNPMASKEVRQFAERKERRANAVSVLVIVRASNS